MAAKLLHSLADDNPDLQKQIGCMTGIFQIFDRQQMVTGRRLNPKKLLPPGESHFVRGSSDRESFNVYHRQLPLDMSTNKSSNEKQRISTESSRASFSSSCSSFSSLDNRTTQPETSSTDRIIFPETPSRDPVLAQPSTCSYSERHSVDLRDVVKDSMYRDARGLSVKTMKNEGAKGNSLKHKDSPRPLQLSKSADGSYGVANGKANQNMPADVHESLRVLAKLREAPWYHNETREHARPSYETKDIWSTVTKDAPRFSYDGRDANRSSFESRDTIKSAPKLKELPRLSLDSRERSMKASISNSKRNSNYLGRDSQNMTNSSGNQNRPASLVAKLMGLETLPDSELASQSGSLKTSLDDRTDSFSRSFTKNNLNAGIRIPKSPRSLMKEPVSPRRKNPDLQMKPISKFPIEPAPWKQSDGARGAQKSPFKVAKAPANTQSSFPSVYSEIEKRLKDLEFKQSGKDLRALKQILEAMQAKGLLETGKEEQDPKFVTQPDFDLKSAAPSQRPGFRQQNVQENLASASRTRASRTYDSPIVIMKPAKLAEKSGIPPSSMIPIDGLPMLRRIQNGGYASSRQGTSASSRAVKDQSPRNTHREPISIPGNKKTNVNRGIRSNQTSSKPQLPTRESSSSSIKSTGSVSPRLQQRKVELERRSRPPTPPSDTNKPRRQSGRQPTESSSPGGKYRMRAPKQSQNDDQLSQISNESRTSSYQGDDMSMHSDSSTVVFDLKTDVEVTSADLSTAEKATNFAVSASMHNKETSKFEEEVSMVELVATPEQPSPVSVLDSSAYKDDVISPIKQTPNMPEGDGTQSSIDCQNDDQLHSSESLSNSTGSTLTSDMSRKKFKNIDNLVQKLTRLNSTHDEASTDYIASLCEKNTNPDHRYISEILLASGLLLRDLGSSGLATFQLHPSGHPINPELFCVLEQTKASNLQTKEENIPLETCHARRTAEKFHRKLIFDAVNDILVTKLDLPGASPVPPRMTSSNKLAKKTITAQKLLKELCSEIEQLQVAKKPEEEEEEDGLKAVLCEDVERRSESWTVFDNEVSGLVLDVERLIFKDLVGEIVMGETAGSQSKIGRRRQLFAK